VVRVALFGFGAIGSEILRYLVERKHEVVAVVDVDPEKAGRTVRELAGLECDVRVNRALGDANLRDVEVAVLSTRSKLDQIAGDIEQLVSRGLDVVTTSEEVAYPVYSGLDASIKIDAIAKEKGVTVVGVGVNPGFVMDWIPALVASASKNPSRIHVVRSVNVSRRRRQLQTKTGVGLTRTKFEKGVAEGILGHVGLVESAHLVALSLGKELEDLKSGVFPVFGSEDYVMGVRQFAEGRAGDCGIRLDLEMTITSADFDVVEVKGEPNLKLRFENGVFGDSATVALAVNAFERIRFARAGLITVLELPLVKSGTL
jgi:4-hydroxy-tetrahydrodipicolinate reductase